MEPFNIASEPRIKEVTHRHHERKQIHAGRNGKEIKIYDNSSLACSPGVFVSDSLFGIKEFQKNSDIQDNGYAGRFECP